jgi:hypothetical protein
MDFHRGSAQPEKSMETLTAGPLRVVIPSAFFWREESAFPRASDLFPAHRLSRRTLVVS